MSTTSTADAAEGRGPAPQAEQVADGLEVGSAETASRAERARSRRNPAPLILLACLALLVGYYGLLLAAGVLNVSTAVPIANEEPQPGPDYVTLQMELEDVNVSTRVIRASVMPAPHGSLVGIKPGEMTRSLRIEISSGETSTSVVTFPGQSIIQATSVDLELDRGDTGYPFDRPFVDFTLSVQDDRTGEAVPFALELEEAAHPWVMTATLGEPHVEASRSVYPVQLDGHRDRLTVALVLFYVGAILLNTLMAVVIIGSALVNRTLDFSNVIWLSATMLAFPTLRDLMPGAPPIGTALDYIVFFPCVSAVAMMLVWTGAHLLRREGTVLLRRRDPNEGAP